MNVAHPQRIIRHQHPLPPARGADVRRVLLDRSCTDRQVLAARLADLGDVAGIVSTLAFAEEPDTDHPTLATGLALSVALVQALGDATIEAPLWSVPRGAVATASTFALHRPRSRTPSPHSRLRHRPAHDAA